MKMKISMLSLIMKPIMTILEVLNNCSKMKILLTKESVCSRELVHEGKLLYILPKYLSKDKQVEITIHRCLHKIPSFPISLRVKNIEPMKVLESWIRGEFRGKLLGLINRMTWNNSQFCLTYSQSQWETRRVCSTASPSLLCFQCILNQLMGLKE